MCSFPFFFFPLQTLQEFTGFEMFIVPSNWMDQLSDGIKKIIRMGRYRHTHKDVIAQIVLS